MRGSAPSKSLSSEAYSNVRQRILRGELKLGQVISRRTLASEMGMHDFNRDIALQKRIVAFVDFPHPSFTKQADNLVTV